MSQDLAAHDCATQTLSRLPAYMNRQRWRELLGVIASEIQEVDDAIVAICFQLHLDHAVGAQLDLIGHELNEARGGREDAEYRHGIEIRIAVNRSRGLAEDIIRVARLVLDNAAKSVELQTTGIASASLAIGGTVAETPTQAALLTAYARTAVGAGIRLLVSTSEVPDAETFRLAGGIGTQSTFDLSAHTGTPIDTVLRAATPGADGNALTMYSEPGGGALTLVETTPGNFRIHYVDAATTIANFEAAIPAHPLIEVAAPSGSPATTWHAPGDSFGSAGAPIAFSGGADATSEVGLGFEGTPPTLLLTGHTGSGFTTVVGYRAFGLAAAGVYYLDFVSDGAAPNAGALATGSGGHREFRFKSGVTTIADFEAKITGDADEYLFLVTASSVPGPIVVVVDEFSAAFIGSAGAAGGQFASVQE